MDEAMMKEISKEELIKMYNNKCEELELSKAFNDTSANISEDTILQWRGKQRFLAEKITPVKLEPIKSKSMNYQDCDNMVIDGDNLSVMHSLLKDCRGRVNIIYMDPPYNTGEEVFPYNDNFNISKKEIIEEKKKQCTGELVSLDDPSRHTKWINHMAPRLWAARKLLSEDGIIIISIDEHELPRLWLLMEEIFKSENRISTLIWNRSRKNDSKYISEGHEYMLVWAKNKLNLDELVKIKGKWRLEKPGTELLMEEFIRLQKMYGDDYKKITLGLKSYVKGIDKTNPLWTVRQYTGVDRRSVTLGPYMEDNPSWPSGNGPRYDVIHPVTKKPVKVPATGWRFTNRDDWERLIQEDRVVWKKVDQGIPKIKKYLLEGRDVEVQTSVIEKESRSSVLMSRAIFGNPYKNPKDHEILKKLFNLVSWNNKNAIVLDPYAGSGTTAQAVIEMNAEDGGNRRFILIEGGFVSKKSKISQKEYTDKITAERIRRVISGKWADGKKHKNYNTGFTYFRAREEITRDALMAADRENLADIILQVAEDESNRIDCRTNGYRYVIGHTRSRCGIALVWGKGENGRTLTYNALKDIVKECQNEKLLKPIHIYASMNEAPFMENVYRFHQIPESIMIRLGMDYLEEISADEDC